MTDHTTPAPRPATEAEAAPAVNNFGFPITHGDASKNSSLDRLETGGSTQKIDPAVVNGARGVKKL